MDSLQYTAFALREILVPVVTITMTVIAMIAGYRRGLFSRKPAKATEPSERTVVISGHINGDVHLTPTNAQRIAIEASKIDDYHQQSISQSKISFWFSLAFASVGFLIIATSVFTYSDKSGYLGIVAGTIIDVVAALFFRESNRARTSMAEFFDRLRADRKIEEALRLCDEISDKAMCDALRVKLSLHFADIGGSEESLAQILTYGQRNDSISNMYAGKRTGLRNEPGQQRTTAMKTAEDVRLVPRTCAVEEDVANKS